MVRLILFDIDGTLIRSGGAGVRAFERTFAEIFGLKGLEDLPAADELRRIPVQKPESLLTVDPGLATAPPEQLQTQEQPAPEPPKDQPESQPSP